MRTVYLHIGMHKTGSSAFQLHCYHNRAALRAAGLHYPDLPFANHSHFLEAQFVADEERARRSLAPWGQEHLLDEREAMRGAFERELREALGAGCDVIVSGEDATHFRAEDARAAVDFFAGLADRVVVLALVRPPVAFARSITQQSVRGGDRTIADFAGRPARPRYRTRFAPWLEAADDVRFGLFRGDTLVAGCPLRTLLAMMDGERPALSGARAKRVNESASLTAVKFFSLVTESLRRRELSADLPAPVRAALSRGFCGSFMQAAFGDEAGTERLPPHLRQEVARVGGPRFVLPAEIAARTREVAQDDTGWMERVMGREIADFREAEGEDAPPLAAFRRFDAAEADALAAALEAVNGRIDEPFGSVRKRAREAERRRLGGYATG